ncbi:MAG: LLM class flavin-dependent oxidoreductase [Promethearchaeota archaeon]
MKRLGLGFSGTPFSVKEILEPVKLADQMNFDSVWIAEDYYYRDAVSYLAASALVTTKISLALGVINPYTRNLALIAMTAATLDELSDGRFLLGMGTGVRFMEDMGVVMGKPLRSMKEAAEILRRILRKEKLTYNGTNFKLKKVQLGFNPVQNQIPLYLAAIGPKMLQLAGEVYDGVLLTAASSPKYIEYAIDHITEGTNKAGKNLEDVDIASYIICAMSTDDEALDKSFIEYFAFNVATADVGYLQLCGIEKEGQAIKEAWKKGGVKKAAEKVTSEVLDALAIYGSPKKCLQGLQRYIDAGVTLPILMPFGSIAKVKSTIETFGKKFL